MWKYCKVMESDKVTAELLSDQYQYSLLVGSFDP